MIEFLLALMILVSYVSGLLENWVCSVSTLAALMIRMNHVEKAHGFRRCSVRLQETTLAA